MFLSDQLRETAVAESPDRSLIVDAADVIDKLYAKIARLTAELQGSDAEVVRLKASEGVW